MESREPRSSDDMDRLRANLGDDVRCFLLRRLSWERLTSIQRQRLREFGLDKFFRRPTYMSITFVCDKQPNDRRLSKCLYGAEGVMTQIEDRCVHLVFKCGDAKHPYQYSEIGIDTIVALAKACEATWPGSISGPIGQVGTSFTDEAPQDAPALDLGDDNSLGLDDEQDDEQDDETCEDHDCEDHEDGLADHIDDLLDDELMDELSDLLEDDDNLPDLEDHFQDEDEDEDEDDEEEDVSWLDDEDDPDLIINDDD